MTTVTCWEPGPGYWANHKRVRRARGPASGYPCKDCGDPARDWSLGHDRSGADPADFDPRCRQCHIAYDQLDLSHPQQGELNGCAKLTWPQVQEIRALRGTVPARVLAARFGVSRSAISMIMIGATWAEP